MLEEIFEGSNPLRTIVISPLIFFPSKKFKTSFISFPICSSNFLVNSLNTCISLSPPQYFLIPSMF